VTFYPTGTLSVSSSSSLVCFLNIDEIHIHPFSSFRFPFLLVDRVIEYNPGVSAVAIKNVTINDNFFPGHFPERPIMPGVLMVEVLSYIGLAMSVIM